MINFLWKASNIVIIQLIKISSNWDEKYKTDTGAQRTGATTRLYDDLILTKIKVYYWVWHFIDTPLIPVLHYNFEVAGGDFVWQGYPHVGPKQKYFYWFNFSRTKTFSSLIFSVAVQWLWQSFTNRCFSSLTIEMSGKQTRAARWENIMKTMSQSDPATHLVV